MTPAIGALNAVEMADDTPHATAITPSRRWSAVTLARSEPTNAPRLANGPYMPTDAPKPIEVKLVNVVSSPVRTGMWLPPVCEAKMTSGMPCGRLPRRSNSSPPTISPPTTGANTVNHGSSTAESASSRACGATNSTSLIHAMPSTNTSEATDAIRPTNAASPKEIRKRCGE